MKIAECMVNSQYEHGNERFFVHIDLDYNKIRGNMNQALKEHAVTTYLEDQYKRIVKPEIEKTNLDGKRKYASPRDAAMKIKAGIMHKYFDDQPKPSDAEEPPESE